MKDHPVEGLMGTTVEKIRQMVDVNTIIGEPIKLDENITIIPVSKVAYGFASGGSDLPTKNPSELFGGAGGAGVTITPIAFVVISDGDVRLMHIATSDNTADRIVNLVPEMVDKVSDMVNKNKKAKSEQKSKPAQENKTAPGNKEI